MDDLLQTGRLLTIEEVGEILDGIWWANSVSFARVVSDMKLNGFLKKKKKKNSPSQSKKNRRFPYYHRGIPPGSNHPCRGTCTSNHTPLPSPPIQSLWSLSFCTYLFYTYVWGWNYWPPFVCLDKTSRQLCHIWWLRPPDQNIPIRQRYSRRLPDSQPKERLLKKAQRQHQVQCQYPNRPHLFFSIFLFLLFALIWMHDDKKEKKITKITYQFWLTSSVYVCVCVMDFRLRKSKMWCMISKCIILPRQSRNKLQAQNEWERGGGGQQGCVLSFLWYLSEGDKGLMGLDDDDGVFYFLFPLDCPFLQIHTNFCSGCRELRGFFFARSRPCVLYIHIESKNDAAPPLFVACYIHRWGPGGEREMPKGWRI